PGPPSSARATLRRGSFRPGNSESRSSEAGSSIPRVQWTPRHPASSGRSSVGATLHRFEKEKCTQGGAIAVNPAQLATSEPPVAHIGKLENLRETCHYRHVSGVGLSAAG